MTSVPGFAPSSHSFHFSNSWPHVPAFDIDVLGHSVPVGNAERGLCGAFNTNINKRAEREWKTRTEQGQEVHIEPSGREFFDHRSQFAGTGY